MILNARRKIWHGLQPESEMPEARPAGLLLTARRRWLACVLSGALSGMMDGPPAAHAHHGFLGKHDFAKPMFLRGKVLRVQRNMPHVRFVVDVPHSGGRVPRDREWMRPLEDAESRPTLTILAPFDRHGEIELTLDWRLSRAVLDDPTLLDGGDQISAVVYWRTARDEYHDELLVVLLRTQDDQVLVSSRPPHPKRTSPGSVESGQ
ncbi:MAG: hypothetical protein Q4A16_07155 [Lautropia sp.]|nr:hypothetical protein [Lautropia sp.]